MPYQISARAYLVRAKNRLNEGTQIALFYAAFELRAGIQARMQEYLRAQEFVAQGKKEDWELGKLGRSIGEAFQLGDRIAQVSVYDDKNGELIDDLYYTPVTSELQRQGERLGELLHAMQQFRTDKDLWWRETRARLEGIWRQLEIACSGTLLAPPLQYAENRIRLQNELLDETASARFRSKFKPGVTALIHVQYLDALPQVAKESTKSPKQ